MMSTSADLLVAGILWFIGSVLKFLLFIAIVVICIILRLIKFIVVSISMLVTTMYKRYFNKVSESRQASDHEVQQLTSDNRDLGRVNSTFNLRRISVRDLVLFQVAEGFFIEGEVVYGPLVLCGITVFLKDYNGDVVQIAMYNQFPFPVHQHRVIFAERCFAIGQKLKIIEPYSKIFMDGNFGIRVDDPSKVVLVDQNSFSSIAEVRREAKALVSKSDYLGALDLYFSCVKNHGKDVIAILNNRAQAEIKLEHYDQALLDAASVLLLDGENETGSLRYQVAFEALSKTIETDDTLEQYESHWLLLLNRIPGHIDQLKASTNESTNKEGNEAYLAGDYTQAKVLYSGALAAYEEFAIILSNITTMCNKLQMYHTAIAAANACMRITRDASLQEKLSYNMSLAFIMLGQYKMSKLAACLVKEGSLNDRLERMWAKLQETVQNVATELMCSRATDVLNASDATTRSVKEKYSEVGEIYNDFVKSDVLEHAYIPNKGRGIIATKKIKEGSILLFEHGIRYNLPEVDNSKINNFEVMRAKLVQHLLGLVKHDGLLAQKLLKLESRKSSNRKLDLISNLGSFPVRHLHQGIKPFMSQSPQAVRAKCSLISENRIKKVVSVNTACSSAEDRSRKHSSITLYPTLSLLNHSSERNCEQTPIACGMVIWVIKDINTREELTIL